MIMSCKQIGRTIAISLLLSLTAGGLAAKDSAEAVPKRDSMIVYPEAIKRVPVQLQVSAWAVFQEIMNRGMVVDPTLAMLSSARNPFCLYNMTIVITKDTCRIEVFVDSLCAGPTPFDSTLPPTDSMSDSLGIGIDDMRVRVVSSAIKPVEFYWPKNLRLDGSSIRATYRIWFADKGDMGFQELFGKYNEEELLMYDSTRAVILR